MIKKLLGLAPQKSANGGYMPSPLALKMATSKTTNYKKVEFSKSARPEKNKIAIICTEQELLSTQNGKKFSTGNHPVEMLVPMLHLQNAGFTFEIFTPSGKPVKMEKWAMPENDLSAMTMYHEYYDQFMAPQSLVEFVQGAMPNDHECAGIFIPGGHGALLGLPENGNLAKLLHWAVKQDLYILAICHGPAALLAAQLKDKEGAFLFAGKKIAAFPDKVDRQTPVIGYMPGHLKWKFGKRLKELGVEIVNSKADDTCHRDGKLISGASPEAAQNFGVMAAKALLEIE